MDNEKHIYRARLDFLYQSIAMYAVTLVIYLIVRSIFVTEAFPKIWQDPLLFLLSAITLLSVFALLYNFYMRRQIEIAPNELRFMSRVRERKIERADVAYVQFGPLTRQVRRIRMVRIKLKNRRRSAYIRLANFERSKKLLADLREWSGPLARDSQKTVHGSIQPS
jgi:hypothetical protein